jgi:glycosyltransferase involved in cell wall biosynthesis
VSVVVTCYNLEPYIGEAIQSVLTQRDAPAFELIVVDDCSTDGSAEIIQGFPEATYVRTPENSGVLLAMIAGVERAKNDIVCLLDGDDLWEPGKLAATAAAFEGDPKTALVTHDLCFIDQVGRPIDRTSRPCEELTPLDAPAAADRVRRGILELGDYVWLGSALSFRPSLARWDSFAAFAKTLSDPRNCYQDWPLAYWIASLAGSRMAYVPKRLFRYRLHGQNYSGDARSVDRAVRNFSRTRNTVAAIVEIGNRHSVSARHKRLARQRLAFNAAQVDLYSGRRLRAVGGLIRGLPSVARDGLMAKELARFAIGALFGPRVLTRIAGLRAGAGPSSRS